MAAVYNVYICGLGWIFLRGWNCLFEIWRHSHLLENPSEYFQDKLLTLRFPISKHETSLLTFMRLLDVGTLGVYHQLKKIYSLLKEK